MENIEIILYIIFAAVAILSRVLKKKDSTPPKPRRRPSQSNNPQQSQSKPQPKSFEDLLREFTDGAETTRQQPEEMEVLESIENSYEYDAIDDVEAEKVYKESVLEAERLKTIDEMVALGDEERHTGNFRHFKGYEEDEEEEEHEILEFLRQEDGPRKAIILSEVLNKRY